MAFKLPNGDILRNLQEQVQKNKEDIQRHYEIERVLADWGIRVIGQMEEWEVPTGSFEYGDAYAVGPDGGPFVFYIYTRGNPDFWLDYGAISIVGPAGPQGPAGVGEKGERGSKWYVGSNPPSGPDIKSNDIWLRISNDGRTDGFVYIYQNGNWALSTSIIGPQGIPGETGPEGPRGLQGPEGPQGPRGYTTITNIIGELPEGTVISDIYNPSTQPDNATVLMPVGGVQHAWVIINGLWTDAGPYSGGSTVYVDGVAVNSFDADTKLDIKTESSIYNQVYAKLTNGTQAMFPVATAGSTAANAIPRYDANGRLTSVNPSSAYHVANKTYVDQAIAAAHNGGTMKSYVWFGQGGTIAGGQIQLGIYREEFENLTLGQVVELPTIQLFYKMSPSSSTYFSVPFGGLRFKLLEGTWDSGKYQIDFVDAGAAVSTLQADCYVNDGILTVNTGYGATGVQYAYAALVIPPSWSSEW